MNAIHDFKTALELLEQNHVIYFISSIPHFCVSHQKQIEIITTQTRYFLPLDDFIALFSEEVFYLHEQSDSFEIDTIKDDEYYSRNYQ